MIDQRDSHTIHFGLNPHVLSAFEPCFDRLVIRQFSQTGLHHGVSHWPAGCVQRVVHRQIFEARLPVFKPRARGVVNRIADLRQAKAVIAVVPTFKLWL